jgi:hypothetical protein
MLQAVIFGFGGLQITNAGITNQKLPLPTKWKTLQLNGVGMEKRIILIK